MEQLYASQSQPVCNAILCVARDRVKVQGRRKYVFTDQIDQLSRCGKNADFSLVFSASKIRTTPGDSANYGRLPRCGSC